MAIVDYTATLKTNPNDAEAFYNRGNAYGNQKEYDKAIADYTAALKINPNYAEAFYSRGYTYGEIKKYDKAIADYTAVLKKYPDLVYALINRGDAYFVKKEYDKAIADYTRAIKLDPNNIEYKQGLEIIQKRGKSSAIFPTGFVGTWKRDNFDNTLTFNKNSFKPSNQNSTRILSNSSGDLYTFYSHDASYWITTITIKLVNGNLVISGDSGDGEDNWNGTWKKQKR